MSCCKRSKWDGDRGSEHRHEESRSRTLFTPETFPDCLRVRPGDRIPPPETRDGSSSAGKVEVAQSCPDSLRPHGL